MNFKKIMETLLLAILFVVVTTATIWVVVDKIAMMGIKP